MGRSIVAKALLGMLVLGLGMNHRDSASEFEATFRKLRDAIQAAVPEADIVLVAPMTSNPKASSVARFPLYLESLRKLESPNVAVADVASPWMSILERKPYYDISGNNFNHPNDFGHRLYAQVIARLFPLSAHSE